MPPLANGIYIIAIIYETLLYNGNCPIINLITKMGVAHTVIKELLGTKNHEMWGPPVLLNI